MHGRVPCSEHHWVRRIERSLGCFRTVEGNPERSRDFDPVTPGIKVSTLPNETRSIACRGPLTRPGPISPAIGKNRFHFVSPVKGIGQDRGAVVVEKVCF